MDDPTRRPTPPPRPERRPRRFHLPHEHHDTRTIERIEAFLDGPPGAARRGRGDRYRRGVDRAIALDTVEEWRSALRTETARLVRYARPATVLVVDVGAEPATVPPIELVPPVLDAIRHEARETDHAVRVSPTRFHLLLPETGEADARRFADRLRDACRTRVNGQGGLLRLRVEAATPTPGASLMDALDHAERRLDY